MNKSILLSFLLTISLNIFSQEFRTTGEVLIYDPALNEIAKGTKIEIIAEGFDWTEGPLWLASENKLIFSDIPKNMIYEWSEENRSKPFLKPSGYTGEIPRSGELGSNGLLLNNQGELVLCQHGDRRIAKMNASIKQPKPIFKTISGTWEGKKFNSPNDAVYNKKGELFFTDPPYGLELNMDDPKKEIPFQGVYKVTKEGKTILLTNEISRPNGIGFSPDESKLYVASSDSLKAIWMVYDLSEEGLLENGKIFYDATDLAKKYNGLPDGLKVHPSGIIFATGPGGVFIFSPEGKLMGNLLIEEATSNCAFDEDFSILYITNDMYILRYKLK